MAYVSKEKKAAVAPVIKAICKKYGMKGSLSVRNHSTLVLTVKQGKLDVIGNYNETSKAKYQEDVRTAKDYIQANQYWLEETYTGQVLAFMQEAFAALKGPDYFDHSDAMTDYFHTSHYVSLNVGAWDKPYVLVED